jgi:hypothetical protein
MKLKCNAIQRFISDYIDDTLSARDTANVETHLQSCAMCQREVDSFKKTRDLVVDFYVEPETSDNYFHEFEVKLHRSIENRGPTRLNQRIKTSVSQYIWRLLTQLRQSFGRYSRIRTNTLPLCAFLLLIATGFVVTHLLNQDTSTSPIVHPKEIHRQTFSGNSATTADSPEFVQGTYNERRTKRKYPNEVSSLTPAADVEKVSYWKLSQPLTTETEEHIIVMHVSKNHSVPSDAANSELVVYAQPDILSSKSPLQDGDYAALPLELHVASFSERYQREHRSLSGVVGKLMHVPSERLTIPEPFDLSGL